MLKQNANYFSFLLRGWRDHEGASWRFSLEGTHMGEQLRFTELQDLVAFLQEQMGTVVPGQDSKTPAAPLQAPDKPGCPTRSTRRRKPAA